MGSSREAAEVKRRTFRPPHFPTHQQGAMVAKAVILVGGGTRGTRFRPISLNTPKVLFNVAGKPILSHAVDAVSQVSSIKEVLFIGFFEDYVFKDYLTKVSAQYPNLSFKYLREYKAMGTAGGLYHFRDVILSRGSSQFFVIHADVVSSFPLLELSRYFETKKAQAVILATRVPANFDTNSFGAIVTDNEGKVVHYVEKPETKISTLINAGVYLFDQSIFEVIADARRTKDAQADILGYSDGNESDILRLEQDVLVKLPSTNAFYAFETKDFWRQLKEAGSAIPANALYLQQMFQADPKAPGLAAPSASIVPPVYIDPTAQVDPSTRLGPDVSIGPHVRIGPGARIKNSIILDNAEIKPHATVLNSIVCDGCRVGHWARVEGKPIGPRDHVVSSVQNGARVQSATILATNVHVANEVHVQNTLVLPHKEIKSDFKNEVIM